MLRIVPDFTLLNALKKLQRSPDRTGTNLFQKWSLPLSSWLQKIRQCLSIEELQNHRSKEVQKNYISIICLFGMVYQVMHLLDNIFKAVVSGTDKKISVIKTALWYDSIYCLRGLIYLCTYSSWIRVFVFLYNIVRESLLNWNWESSSSTVYVCPDQQPYV